MLNFSGPVWRILFQSQIAAPLAAAQAPEGRFHHSGQVALYCSLSAEGAGVAIRRYVCASDPPRVLQRAQLSNARLVDLRGQPDASIVWQNIREQQGTSPTWNYSDSARDIGADGLMYSSRTRPELSHIVLFDFTSALIRADTLVRPWTPPYL
ncbi:RES family NAD+ phosphorylase [Ruegeria atlantica]|uniref:RES family NAD+ phosphorylase n=1 Tax=Ruegeria atlantica TaxID=81569 RepID=UPI00147F2E5D|nr:RES family NAD+ phosphorylase [Ruegeria atlantica]